MSAISSRSKDEISRGVGTTTREMQCKVTIGRQGIYYSFDNPGSGGSKITQGLQRWSCRPSHPPIRRLHLVFHFNNKGDSRSAEKTKENSQIELYLSIFPRGRRKNGMFGARFGFRTK